MKYKKQEKSKKITQENTRKRKKKIDADRN